MSIAGFLRHLAELNLTPLGKLLTQPSLEEAAASDKVRVTSFAPPLPASDITTTVCPAGLTSSTSMSDVQV